jgi:hypothetical protein
MQAIVEPEIMIIDFSIGNRPANFTPEGVLERVTAGWIAQRIFDAVRPAPSWGGLSPLPSVPTGRIPY